MRQQFTSVSGIFTVDQVDDLNRPDGAKRHVLQISDR